MKTKRRNRVETQRGNEESEDGGAGKGSQRDMERGGQGENIPCPLVPLSPRRPAPPSLHLLLSVQLTPWLCVSAWLRLSAGATALVEGEAEFESGAHAHRLSVLNRRMKSYFLGRLDGGLG